MGGEPSAEGHPAEQEREPFSAVEVSTAAGFLLGALGALLVGAAAGVADDIAGPVLPCCGERSDFCRCTPGGWCACGHVLDRSTDARCRHCARSAKRPFLLGGPPLDTVRAFLALPEADRQTAGRALLLNGHIEAAAMLGAVSLGELVPRADVAALADGWDENAAACERALGYVEKCESGPVGDVGARVEAARYRAGAHVYRRCEGDARVLLGGRR